MIASGMKTGSVALTASEDADTTDETLTVVATGPGIAGSQRFAITAADNDAPARTIRAKAGAADRIAAAVERASGGSARLTATACAADPAGACLETAVPVDTEVQILRDGSSTAGAADYEAGAITILAGETSGYTQVTAVEDGEPDSGSGAPEMLTLYGPALPVVAQLLLAALLAARGVRRWRRR